MIIAQVVFPTRVSELKFCMQLLYPSFLPYLTYTIMPHLISLFILSKKLKTFSLKFVILDSMSFFVPEENTSSFINEDVLNVIENLTAN